MSRIIPRDLTEVERKKRNEGWDNADRDYIKIKRDRYLTKIGLDSLKKYLGKGAISQEEYEKYSKGK